MFFSRGRERGKGEGWAMTLAVLTGPSHMLLLSHVTHMSKGVRKLFGGGVFICQGSHNKMPQIG